MNETKVFDREEDEFLNELLTDDTALEYWANDVIDSSSSTGTNSLLSEDNDYHHVLVQGVDAVMSYFLLLLQMCPDKVTEISDIQLKQSVADMERTEICCKFNVKNTRLYDLTPLHFLATLEDDLQKLTINDQNTSPTEIIKQEEDGVHGKTKKKRTLDSIKTDKMEKHQLLFDPISGIFLQSRFPRSESPIQYQVEGNMTLVVDQNKRIESIIINPKERVQLPRK
eukprot:gene14007-15473_t